jgi:hypothetical protein
MADQACLDPTALAFLAGLGLCVLLDRGRGLIDRHCVGSTRVARVALFVIGALDWATAPVASSARRHDEQCPNYDAG